MFIIIISIYYLIYIIVIQCLEEMLLDHFP